MYISVDTLRTIEDSWCVAGMIAFSDRSMGGKGLLWYLSNPSTFGRPRVKLSSISRLCNAHHVLETVRRGESCGKCWSANVTFRFIPVENAVRMAMPRNAYARFKSIWCKQTWQRMKGAWTASRSLTHPLRPSARSAFRNRRQTQSSRPMPLIDSSVQVRMQAPRQSTLKYNPIKLRRSFWVRPDHRALHRSKNQACSSTG
jgi:hypothetical protein